MRHQFFEEIVVSGVTLFTEEATGLTGVASPARLRSDRLYIVALFIWGCPFRVQAKQQGLSVFKFMGETKEQLDGSVTDCQETTNFGYKSLFS